MKFLLSYLLIFIPISLYGNDDLMQLLDDFKKQNELSKVRLNQMYANLDDILGLHSQECYETLLEKKKRKLDHFSATSKEVEFTTCRQNNAYTGFYQNLLAGALRAKQFEDNLDDREIMGIKFSSQPKLLLDSFEKLVTPQKNYFEKLGSEESPDPIVEKYIYDTLKGTLGESGTLKKSDISYDFKKVVPDNCHDINCASKAIFGEDRWDEILILILIFDLNASEFAGHKHFGTKHVSAWTEDELKAIISAIDNFPFLVDYAHTTISHFDRSTKYGVNHEGLNGNSTLIFFNALDSKDMHEQEYIFFHEFSHRIINKVGREGKLWNEWLDLTSWSSQKPHNAPSYYAEASPTEDFAESVSAYRYTGQALKERSPERYEFIRKYVFNGQDFLTEDDCQKWNSPQKVFNKWLKDNS